MFRVFESYYYNGNIARPVDVDGGQQNTFFYDVLLLFLLEVE